MTTADHALLDAAMIADFCAEAEGADLAIGLVERARADGAPAGTKRTWLGFRGGAYTGANLFAFGSAKAAKAVELVARRSSRTARRAGGCSLALGRPGLLGPAAAAHARPDAGVAWAAGSGLTCARCELDDPLAAVDVDKPADHELVTAILEGALMTDLAIYDMDRTVTRRATYTPFLLHCALRRAPWRLLFAAVRRSCRCWPMS